MRKELREGVAADTYGLYANADGTGSALYKSIACYKAISESLERWAFYETSNSSNAAEYGFNIDPSTTGMAAYPGITNGSVINHARNEALERWALVEWWTGHLNVTQVVHNGFDCLEISISGFGFVCISWTRQNEKWAYGFACAKTFKLAFEKAQIELFRNLYLLSKFTGPVDKLNLQEKRVLYFSSEDGHRSFILLSDNSLSVNRNKSPLLVLNKEIKGPWSQYSTVWRCLYNSTNANSEKLDFFLF